jgi:hypothetical protein
MTSKCKLVLLAMAAVGTAMAQSSTPWELGHPDAKLLMGIDVRSLRESPTGRSLEAQMSSQMQQAGPMAMGFMGAFNILNQIDRVFLSSPANQTAGAKRNPPFLLVVEGRFPPDQLRPFLRGTVRHYRTTDVYRTSQTDTTSIALLDAQTIVLGDEKSVLAAIDRRGRTSPATSPILTRAQQMASTHDFWMIAEDSLSKFQPANAGINNPFASQIKGLDMGLSMHDGLQFEMNLAAESDAAAAQMTQMLTTQLQMAMLAQANRPEGAEVAEIARKLQIGTEGNRMHVSLAMTQQELDQQIRAMQVPRAMTGARRPPAQPANPPSDHPGKIRIYGLDEGVREIPLTH